MLKRQIILTLAALLSLGFTRHEAVASDCGFTVKGLVVDVENMPLPGVIIRYGKENQGVISDVDGVFMIHKLSCMKQELRISYIGYQSLKLEVAPVHDSVSLKITLSPATHQLSEVKVMSSREGQTKRTESISVDFIQADFISRNQSGSLMQTLQAIPGVQAMSIGTGISKPMIRGLSYYRVGFAKNGIKQSGQHWSSHTGLSIDQHQISRLEVIRGPASLRFGSDAIGGIINTLPPNIPQNGNLEGSVSFTAKSNTSWLGGSAGASSRMGKFYFHTQITHNNFGDFKVPYTDVFLLPRPVSAAEATHEVPLGKTVPNTAGRENAFSMITGIVEPWGNHFIDFSYHQTKTGFFDWIGLQHDEKRQWHMASSRDIKIPHQEVKNIDIYYFANIYSDRNKVELALGYQYNTSAEHSLLTDRTGNRAEDIVRFRKRNNLELKLDLHNFTFNGMYSIRQFDSHKLDVILNIGYERNIIDGYNHILPNYDKLSAGIGFIYQYVISPKWVLNSGSRIDWHGFGMQEQLNPDPAFGDPVFNPAFQKDYYGTSFSLGFNYLWANHSLLKMHLGKSYRIPSAYELGAYGLHRHEGRFERGDTNIEPEQAWHLDIGIESQLGPVMVTLSPFVNYFSSYLYLNPTPVLRPEGQVYEYKQTVALLYGGEISVDYSFNERMHLLAGMEYVYAMNLDLNAYLPFTPPLSAITSVSYKLGSYGSLTDNLISVEGRWVAAQNYTVPNELKTPGYGLLNISVQSRVNVYGTEALIRLEAANLLNHRYYNHISFYRRMRIPEPGRDIRLFVNIKI